jgi:organic hydroperoxide reductase OsmC/OhrA
MSAVAAAYGACFHSALMAEAKGAGVDLADSTIVAHVGLGPTAQGPHSSAIRGNVGVRFLLGGKPLAPAAARPNG